VTFPRRINEAEAEVVRKISRLYADGHGFANIARVLTPKA
jgi:hypothetical protein